jgi:PAS domain S-box-containing protein
MDGTLPEAGRRQKQHGHNSRELCIRCDPAIDRRAGGRHNGRTVDIDELAFTSAPTGLAVVDLAGRFTRVNHRLARMLRRPPAELHGRLFVDFVHPEDRDRADLRLDELVPQTMHDRGRVRFLRPDESEVWGGVGITRIGADAEGASAVINVADLSDLVRAEQRIGNVVGGLDDGVVVFDPAGGLVSANPAAVRLLGKMVGGRWGDGTRDVDITLLDDDGAAIPLEARPEVTARVDNVASVASATVVVGDGEVRWLEIAAQPIERAHNERWVVATYKDVSEHRRVADALRASVEADRAKSQFLSRMSHELRTPLNSVLGFAQLLDMGVLDERQRESVSQILAAGRHLLDLVDELLDLDRIERDQLDVDVEPVRVEGALREAFELVQPLALAKGIAVELHPGRAARSSVVADRRRLRQVLLNLLTNAIKFNRPNGSVTVTCRQSEGTVVLRVHDTGHGLRPDEIDRIFVPFERLRADELGIEGMGVGLALSKRLVEAMGGLIGVESEPGEGSTFWVVLRIATTTLASEPAGPPLDADHAAEVLASTAPVRRRVLCIEDNDASRQLLRGLLGHVAGLEVVTAAGGIEGLELARADPPDAVLLDLHLPDSSGEEVLHALRSDPSTRGAAVIVVSADAVPARVAALTEAGARAYLTKPIDAMALFAALEAALEIDPVASNPVPSSGGSG